jgi:hypothetical protein
MRLDLSIDVAVNRIGLMMTAGHSAVVGSSCGSLPREFTKRVHSFCLDG